MIYFDRFNALESFSRIFFYNNIQYMYTLFLDLCFRTYASTHRLPLTVLVTTIDAQWEGMGDVGSAGYEPALLPPCPTIRVLSYSN